MINPTSALKRLAMVSGVSLFLTGCVSLGSAEAPPSLLTLTADTSVSAGTLRSGKRTDALVILLPETPRKLNTARIPVQVSSSSIAYLKDAVWADKPAKLWQELLAETIAARTNRLILNNIDAGGKEKSQLSGILIEFGIDAASNEAVIVYDAVKHRDSQSVEKKRFEIRKSVYAIEAAAAGEVLNEAANELAKEVSDWVK